MSNKKVEITNLLVCLVERRRGSRSVICDSTKMEELLKKDSGRRDFFFLFVTSSSTKDDCTSAKIHLILY